MLQGPSESVEEIIFSVFPAESSTGNVVEVRTVEETRVFGGCIKRTRRRTLVIATSRRKPEQEVQAMP